MSSILKALRKVEEEKRATSHAAPDLRSDQGASVHVKKSTGPLLTGMLLGAVCVGLFLYFMPAEEKLAQQGPHTDGTKVVEIEPAQPKPTAKPAIGTIPVVTLPPEPVSVEANVRPDTSSMASHPDEFKKSNSKIQQAKPAEVKQKTAVTSAEFKPTAKQPLPSEVNLVVSEIFYQDSPANSMAVVNDLPVMVGTAVDGALIQGIFPDHVKVRVNGKDYPIYQGNH